jgi:cytochrome c oxidase subunit 2
MRVALSLSLLVLCAAPMARAQEPARPPREVQVTASRYHFDPAVIEAGEGEHVVLHIHSADVTHGFGIKALGIDVTIPEGGAPVTVEFDATKPGTYLFECTEFCGKGHPDMRGRLIVRPLGTPVGTGAPAARDEREVDPAEPDFTIVNLPTTLRLPRHRMWFDVTHRFGRPLGAGDFGDLLGDFFGFDSGAQIGLGLRYGIRSGTQLAIYRTNERTIQFLAQQSLVEEQKDGAAHHPLSADVLFAIEGRENFHEEYAPTVALVLSRRLSDRGAVYAVPAFVAHAGPDDGTDRSTVMVGLGARYRFGGHASLVGEVSPRLAGYKQGHPLASFGLESRVGGHSFQINVSNGLGSTLAQVARGGAPRSDWFLGFNITRKFY